MPCSTSAYLAINLCPPLPDSLALLSIITSLAWVLDFLTLNFSLFCFNGSFPNSSLYLPGVLCLGLYASHANTPLNCLPAVWDKAVLNHPSKIWIYNFLVSVLWLAGITTYTTGLWGSDLNITPPLILNTSSLNSVLFLTRLPPTLLSLHPCSSLHHWHLLVNWMVS